MIKYRIAKFRVRIYYTDTGMLQEEAFFADKYELWRNLYIMGHQYPIHKHTIEVSKLDTASADYWKPLAEF